MITADQNAFDASASLLGTAVDKTQDLFTGAGSLRNINNYINPFYEQVLDRTLGRMNTNFQHQLNQIGDQATAAGAFGGGRHGIVEGQAYGQHNLNVGDVTANIQQQAYTDAASRATQDYMSGLSGTIGLSDDYFRKGMDTTQLNTQQGSMQQALIQQLLSGGKREYSAAMQQPFDMLNLYASLLAGDPRRAAGSANATQEYNPGAFDFLSLLTQAVGGM